MEELIINLINKQKEKEDINKIWLNSKFKDIIKLQSNNVGIIGEEFIKNICDLSNINNNIDGIKSRKKGGGFGDGVINDKIIEIKTAVQSSSNTFQHELGEKPYLFDYLIFIDISPEFIYLTIFKNFDENVYKNKIKCHPYFPTKIITWRKNIGAFKLDTSVKINEENIIKGYTIKITNETNMEFIKNYINSIIK